MNTSQLNKYDMYHTTFSALADLPPAAVSPALRANIAQLRAKLARLDTLAQVQAQPTHGVIADRERVLAAAETAAITVGGLVHSYAHAHARFDLAARTHVTRSDFHQMARGARMSLARRVHDAAQSVLAEVADYGLTSAQLDDLEAKIAAAERAVIAPRMAVVRRKAATGCLAVRFAEIDALLRNQIDPLLSALRQCDRPAYSRYRGARRIIHRGASRRSQPANVIEAATPPPLAPLVATTPAPATAVPPEPAPSPAVADQSSPAILSIFVPPETADAHEAALRVSAPVTRDPAPRRWHAPFARWRTWLQGSRN